MYVDMNRGKVKRVLMVLMLALILAGGGSAGYLYYNGANSDGDAEKATLSEDSATTNWGLSFQHKGKAPIGNATADELGKYNAYYVDTKGKKTIYLTFDAGFENGYTEKILNVLKEEKVPAAFFLVGTYIESNPKLIKRMVKEGHIVGNHTMSHPDMSAIREQSAFKAELDGVEEKYKAVTGKNMEKFYRPPQGKFSVENLKQAKELGYTTVFWSLAYVDWYVDKQPTREEALSKLMPRTHHGAVVLLHSTSKTNAQILRELITKWKEEGYQFKTISELIHRSYAKSGRFFSRDLAISR